MLWLISLNQSASGRHVTQMVQSEFILGLYLIVLRQEYFLSSMDRVVFGVMAEMSQLLCHYKGEQPEIEASLHTSTTPKASQPEWNRSY